MKKYKKSLKIMQIMLYKKFNYLYIISFISCYNCIISMFGARSTHTIIYNKKIYIYITITHLRRINSLSQIFICKISLFDVIINKSLFSR